MLERQLGFSVFLGLRYSIGAGSSQLVSFLSRLSMLGLVLGIALLVVVLAVMNGFDREMRERILGLVPHVIMSPLTEAASWEDLERQLAAEPGVLATAPMARFNLMLVSGRQVEAGAAVAIDPARESGAFILDRFTDLSVLQSQHGDVPVLLGAALADKLDVVAGDTLSVGIPRSRAGETRVAFSRVRMAGRVDTGTELDQGMVIMSLDSLALLPGGAPRIGLKLVLDDLFLAPGVAWDLSARYGGDWQSNDWTRQLGNLYHAIQMSRRLVVVLLLSVIAVAVFNVVSTLVMVVNDKQRDIAILRSQGATPGAVLRIFVVYGATIGAAGALAGGLLGWLLALSIGDLVIGIERLLGRQLLNSDVYPINYLPSELRAEDLFLVCGLAWIMSVLATLYPAWRAARINPAAALRFH